MDSQCKWIRVKTKNKKMMRNFAGGCKLYFNYAAFFSYFDMRLSTAKMESSPLVNRIPYETNTKKLGVFGSFLISFFFLFVVNSENVRYAFGIYQEAFRQVFTFLRISVEMFQMFFKYFQHGFHSWLIRHIVRVIRD